MKGPSSPSDKIRMALRVVASLDGKSDEASVNQRSVALATAERIAKANGLNPADFNFPGRPARPRPTVDFDLGGGPTYARAGPSAADAFAYGMAGGRASFFTVDDPPYHFNAGGSSADIMEEIRRMMGERVYRAREQAFREAYAAGPSPHPRAEERADRRESADFYKRRAAGREAVQYLRGAGWEITPARDPGRWFVFDKDGDAELSDDQLVHLATLAGMKP